MEMLKLVISFYLVVKINFSYIKALFLSTTLLSSGSWFLQLVSPEHKM